MKKNRIKTGDSVKVISGSFFGKTGKVVKVSKHNNFACLEEIFREKFVKSKNNEFRQGNSEENVSENELPKKKKVLIPINISNIKKHYVENKE